MKPIQAHVIHKFGGSSLANAQRFIAVRDLLGKKQESVVVSAMQGVTSALQHVLDDAKERKSYHNQLRLIAEKHLTVIRELSLDRQLENLIQNDIDNIQKILHSIELTGFYGYETQQMILGYGEVWSAFLLADFLSQSSNRPVVCLDASKVLYVLEQDGQKQIQWEKSRAALAEYLASIKDAQLVITGFIASTLDGYKTTLGRNGSDFSAAIFANLFDATNLIIWTDVDGVFTADPRLVKSAYVIDALSYQEALELAYFGSKVLHPSTIAPLASKNIPVWIKNSYNPEAPGTLITSEPKSSSHLIKGISYIDNIAIISIEGTGLMSVSKITARISARLQYYDIPIYLIAQASSAHSLCLAIPSHLAGKAVERLTEDLQYDIEHHNILGVSVEKNAALVAIVGDRMIGQPGIAYQLTKALAKSNISICAISQGASERNISLVIKQEHLNTAMQAIHAGFYLSHQLLSIGLIGPGTVGGCLLKQLEESLESLLQHNGIQLEVYGIMNSSRMLLARTPIALSHWKKQFEENAIPADLQQFIAHIKNSSITNSVIIDCTANKEVANSYLSVLERGIHIITPNKHANAGDLSYYHALKNRCNKKPLHYFYEATVCAGLPVIRTLQDLILTGDSIDSIEGIVSGTLSYIFNAMRQGQSFSDAVLKAKQLGYTEPDPREDLSGMDVARKLVCLARELGISVNLADVAVYDLVPESLKSCDIQTFLNELPRYDASIQERLIQAQHQNQTIHYVGSIEKNGTISVEMKAISCNHPFSRLEGTDNMLVFKTKRYHTRPLTIQGPGAGDEVTAAGIFTDLLRLVSVLS